MTCETCRYYKASPQFDRTTKEWFDLDYGRCHRRSPRPVSVAEAMIKRVFGVDDDLVPRWTTWPSVSIDDWCGEWAERQGRDGEIKKLDQ